MLWEKYKLLVIDAAVGVARLKLKRLMELLGVLEGPFCHSPSFVLENIDNDADSRKHPCVQTQLAGSPVSKGLDFHSCSERRFFVSEPQGDPQAKSVQPLP